jgi:phage-related protein
MQSVGASVREMRIRDRGGAFRVLYIATDAVYILHAFQKKTRGYDEAGFGFGSAATGAPAMRQQR